jgi:N-acetylglucosaminyldiphosphoundecaprenol N-acetyl-beta-D-mannosaminyltransferase
MSIGAIVPPAATLVPSDGRVRLFDVDIDALDGGETLRRAFALADRGTPSQHVVLNAAKVVQMAGDERLREIVRSCDLVNADGASIVWASRVLGRPVPERVAGIDLFAAIVERAAATGHSVYFLGATDEVLEEMIARFRSTFPALRIAGARNGYWDDDGEVIAEVRRAQPDFLFLAIPSPRKEYWLNEHLDDLGVPFVMGVGGSFDVIAGKVRRAPVWVQRVGGEWLYRLCQEPRRMWKRYLVGNVRFVALTAQEWRLTR